MLRKITTLAILGLTYVAAQTQLRGVDYGIQKPDGSCTSYSDVLSDFQQIATFAQGVKIYNMGFCNGAENCIIAARATGLKLFLGMAAGPPDAFQNELSILKRLGSQYGFANILGVTVGSEDLYRQDITASTIANYIQQTQAVIKSVGGSIPVTHTDVYYMQPAEIINVEDIVMFNAFTFWEGQPIENALNVFISHYNAVVQSANGKPVWIGETGWPSSGTTQASAVASTQNAATYLQQFVCWANANGVPYFYFEAYNEPWKASGQNGDIEPNFGIYNADRTPKSYARFTCPGSGSSTPASTTSSAPAATSSSSSCQAMFASTTCRTSSEDPSQVDANSVNNARGWLCANYPQYCTAIQSGGQYSSCNSVEQISYAMSQYYNAQKSSQGDQACNFSGLGHIATPSAQTSSTTGQAAATSSTTSKAAAATSSTTSAAATSSSNSCQSMFASTTCRTSSEDPSQVDANSVNNARGWLCANYPQYCTAIQSGGQYSSCNSVEQISYAMSQYYNAYKSTQGDQACNFSGLGHIATPSAQASSTTSNSPAATPKTSSSTSSSSTSAVQTSAAQTSSAQTCEKASYCSPTLCACSGACYDTTQYCCPNGKLTQKSFC